MAGLRHNYAARRHALCAVTPDKPVHNHCFRGAGSRRRLASLAERPLVMSALGHKQTYAAQNWMSAKGPIADILLLSIGPYL